MKLVEREVNRDSSKVYLNGSISIDNFMNINGLTTLNNLFRKRLKMHLIEHALLFRKKDFAQSAEKQFNVEVMKSLDKSLETYQGELFARLLDTVKAIEPEALRYVWIQSKYSSLKLVTTKRIIIEFRMIK